MNSGGVVEELYFLAGDSSIASVFGPEFTEACDAFVKKLQKGLEREGPPAKRKFGAVEGRALTYRGESGDGRKVEVVVYAFQGTGSACGLFAFGLEEALASRRESVEAILASMWRPKSKAGVLKELVGTWAYMKGFTSDHGRTGRRTYSQIVLNGDGSYVWNGQTENWAKSEKSDGKPWSHDSSQAVRGTWVADDESITLTPEGGQPYTFVLEKRNHDSLVITSDSRKSATRLISTRTSGSSPCACTRASRECVARFLPWPSYGGINHPKNVNDPMIVLDGVEYVTTFKRDPW